MFQLSATDKIKFKTTDEKPCQLTFSVNIPLPLVNAKQDEVLKEFQKVAQLPGFRAGKAPLDLVKKNFSDKVKSRAFETLLQDAVAHVLQEKAITPVTTPMVDKIKFDENSPISFDLIIERSPEFTAKNYTKIPVERKQKKISEADVQKELDTLRERNASLVLSKAEKLEKTHFAIVDYTGTIDDQPVPELKAENQMLDLSAPQTIKGFAEGILGMSKGETKEIKMSFPAEYANPKLAGKEVVFKVTVQDIKEKFMPALDDEFAKDFGLGSLAELKTKVEESLKGWAEKSVKSEMEKQIYDHLLKENPIPVPPSLVSSQLESLVEGTLHNQQLEINDGKKIEDLKASLGEKLKPQAERLVQLSYLIGKIAKAENLRATDEDYRKELEGVEQGNPGKKAEIYKYFEENSSRIFSRITEEKVLKFLTDHAKVKDVEAAK